VAHVKHRLLLGAHMSISGGLQHALEDGTQIGCTTIQCFTKSNRQWHAKPITPEEVEIFKKAQKQSDIHPIVAHASYLINIGSPNHATAEKSYGALQEELVRCHLLGIPYLVLHPGSHLGTDVDACLKRIAQYASNALKHAGGDTTLLFETMAGQGSAVGSTFEELAWLVHHTTPHKRVGICMDTCHIFAAGYDFRTPELYTKMWHHFDKIIGRHFLKAIHCNDSIKDVGGRVDRHADIGSGKIGTEGFRLIMNDPSLFHIPKILETPKESLSDDTRNMKKLIGLLSPATKQLLQI
jgi:deoxyribonuclease IV